MIVFAVLHLKQSRMEVVLDKDGVRRKVEVTWTAKDQTDVPPPVWAEMAEEELSVKDAEAFARSQGRQLPEGY